MHSTLIRRILVVSAAITSLVASTDAAQASCPFCSAISRTLRQEMQDTDGVILATMVAGSKTETDAEFTIERIIQGDSLLAKGKTVRVNYFGKEKDGQNYLIMGVDPPDMLWSVPQPISSITAEYIQAISKLPKDKPLDRLRFYLDYLEHPESMLARDAYDEFASAPYEQIIALKDELKHDKLLEWIKQRDMPPERRRMYLVMLGVCGQEKDAELLEEMLRSDDPEQRAGLDSLIACYVTLKKEAGLELIDKLYLANKESPYPDTYAAVMALRFHGTEGGIVKKQRVLESLRLILDRPDLADLVIPDLARWEDWTQIDKVVELFKAADDSKSSWVRVPVINYLRVCPKPEAKKALEVVKEIDPAAYKRATSFFPLPPSGGPDATDSSMLHPLSMPYRTQLAMADTADSSIAHHEGKMVAEQSRKIAERVSQSNPAITVVVICTVAATLGILMWLFISGAGQHGFGSLIFRFFQL